MRRLWLAVLAVAVLVLYSLQREQEAERSPATERGSVGQDAPQTPNAPPPPAESSAPQAPGADGAQPAGAAGHKKGIADDPIERGPCSLFLRAVSADTGEPARTQAYLYRLDAPRNELWTPGDSWQATVAIEKSGTLVEALPQGDYRVFAPSQPREGEDPPAFRVSGARTEHTLRIPMLRSFRVYLVVYDERGQPLQHAKRHHTGKMMIGSSLGFEKRELQLPAVPKRQGGGNRDRSATGLAVERFRNRLNQASPAAGGSSGNEIRAGPAGFDFGLQREDTRFWRWTASYRLKFEQRSEVRFELKGDAARDRTYLALSVPLTALHDLVVLPDGRRAIDAGASVGAHCDTVLEREDAVPDAWQSLPVNVTVSLAGYEKLAFEYRMNRRPPLHTLKPVGK